jgi:hypothetical protein
MLRGSRVSVDSKIVAATSKSLTAIRKFGSLGPENKKAAAGAAAVHKFLCQDDTPDSKKSQVLFGASTV